MAERSSLSSFPLVGGAAQGLQEKIAEIGGPGL